MTKITKTKQPRRSARTLVLKNAIKREPGYLYFIDAEGSIFKTKAKTGSKPKREKYKKVGYYYKWRKRKEAEQK